MTELTLFEAELELSRPFRIARGTRETLEVLFLRIREGDSTGWGEAHPAPDVTGETALETREALASLDPDEVNALDPASTLAAHEDLGPAARSALDLALHDLAGRQADQPVHTLLDLPCGHMPCAGTVTVSDPDDAAEQAREWLRSGFFHLKVKIEDPEDGLEATRRVAELLPTDLPDRFPEPEVWVDANEALDLDQAQALLTGLDTLGARLVEQPLPRAATADLAHLAQDAPVPILLDESVQSPEDVRAVGRIEGPTMANIKVQKVGGLQAASACLDAGQATGTPLVVGCNIETGLGIAAGSALTGAVDRADLDGNRFLANEPFPLARPRPGFAGTPEGPGLGAYPDPGKLDALDKIVSLGTA